MRLDIFRKKIGVLNYGPVGQTKMSPGKWRKKVLHKIFVVTRLSIISYVSQKRRVNKPPFLREIAMPLSAIFVIYSPGRYNLKRQSGKVGKLTTFFDFRLRLYLPGE
jgi:hypothetical protein